MVEVREQILELLGLFLRKLRHENQTFLSTSRNDQGDCHSFRVFKGGS